MGLGEDMTAGLNRLQHRPIRNDPPPYVPLFKTEICLIVSSDVSLTHVLRQTSEPWKVQRAPHQQSAGGIEALGTDSPPTLARVGKIMLLWAVKRSSASAEIGARVAYST